MMALVIMMMMMMMMMMMRMRMMMMRRRRRKSFPIDLNALWCAAITDRHGETLPFDTSVTELGLRLRFTRKSEIHAIIPLQSGMK